MTIDWSVPEPPPRPDLYVVARFLDRLSACPGGYPRTRLQSAVRLNYDLYKSYLSLLLRRGLVELAPDADAVERVHLTREGRDAHGKLVAWLRAAIGEIEF